MDNLEERVTYFRENIVTLSPYGGWKEVFLPLVPPAPPPSPDPAPASPEPPAAPAPLSASAGPGEVVREPPLQVRRHWPLEHEELTEEHEPEQRSSPPHETRHRPLLHKVDRP